jgi:hypothetical protein
MKHFREELWFDTPHRRDYVNITDKVAEAAGKSGAQRDMVEFVKAIARRGRSKSASDFAVFVQNGEVLCRYKDYLAVVTGIGDDGSPAVRLPRGFTYDQKVARKCPTSIFLAPELLRDSPSATAAEPSLLVSADTRVDKD